MKNISLLPGYIYLMLAILTGINSHGFLKTTEGFTKLWPTLFCVANMFVCIFCLSKAMSVIPVGIGLYESRSISFLGSEYGILCLIVGFKDILTID